MNKLKTLSKVKPNHKIKMNETEFVTSFKTKQITMRNNIIQQRTK